MYVDVIYDSFTVGKYNGGRNDGITLNFIEPSTNLMYFTIFNVKRKGTKGKRKDKYYPGNKFRLTKWMKFYRIWTIQWDMPLPPRGITAFNECMGKLKQIKFKALIKQGNQPEMYLK